MICWIGVYTSVGSLCRDIMDSVVLFVIYSEPFSCYLLDLFRYIPVSISKNFFFNFIITLQQKQQLLFWGFLLNSVNFSEIPELSSLNSIYNVTVSRSPLVIPRTLYLGCFRSRQTLYILAKYSNSLISLTSCVIMLTLVTHRCCVGKLRVYL